VVFVKGLPTLHPPNISEEDLKGNQGKRCDLNRSNYYDYNLNEFKEGAFGKKFRSYREEDKDLSQITYRRRKALQNPPLMEGNKLTTEQMEKEKQFLKSQYDFPPLCNDFEIIYEDSVKFNK
jgi:hypothetical protein